MAFHDTLTPTTKHVPLQMHSFQKFAVSFALKKVKREVTEAADPWYCELKPSIKS